MWSKDNQSCVSKSKNLFNKDLVTTKWYCILRINIPLKKYFI